MQAVCDILEQLVSEEVLKQYAIGGATAAGFHGEPLATRDGRIRHWGRIPEMDNRILRVIVVEDAETVHNAFFDRNASL